VTATKRLVRTCSLPEAYSGYVKSLVGDDFEPAARELDVQTLVIAGAEDRPNLAMVQSHWMKKLKHADTVVLQECGHWGLLEMPLRIGSIAEEFLSAS
jgi:pimeloyl-ACP methyl ester carboxylesterase